MSRIERALGLAVAGCMLAMMAITVLDVVARKLLGTSVRGGVEVVELLMLGVVFAGLPLVSLKGEHIFFDMLDTLLPRGLLKLQSLISNAVCALLLAGAGILVLQRARRTIDLGDVTPDLALGVGKFQVVIGLLLFATAAVHLLLVVRGRTPPSENTP